MEEIKVGEYVRTEKQGIKRIDTIFENKTVNKYGYEIGSEWDGKLYSTIKTTDIIKHSKNIIDLIEEGDYVNGYKVDFVQNNEIVYNHDHPYQLNMFAKDIKSIVTKQQFLSMEYRLED